MEKVFHSINIIIIVIIIIIIKVGIAPNHGWMDQKDIAIFASKKDCNDSYYVNNNNI
jgi:hypothetical protein